MAINDFPMTGQKERKPSRVNSRSDDAEWLRTTSGPVKKDPPPPVPKVAQQGLQIETAELHQF